jgi:hypothetical protein
MDRGWGRRNIDTGGEIKLLGFAERRSVSSEFLRWAFHSQNAEAYLSFWVNSPRPLEDLLLEPNLPRVDFQASQRGAVQIWPNGKKVADKTDNEANAVAEALRLRSGWNRLLVKLVHTTGPWEFTGHFTASQPGFIAQMDSSLEKP